MNLTLNIPLMRRSVEREHIWFLTTKTTFEIHEPGIRYDELTPRATATGKGMGRMKKVQKGIPFTEEYHRDIQDSCSAIINDDTIDHVLAQLMTNWHEDSQRGNTFGYHSLCLQSSDG